MKASQLVQQHSDSGEPTAGVRSYLSQTGYAPASVQRYLRAIDRFLEWVPQQVSAGDMTVDVAIARFLDSHVPSCRCSPRCPERKTSRAALGHLKRIAGRLDDDDAGTDDGVATHIREELRGLEHYLCQVRGLSKTTCIRHCRVVRDFLVQEFKTEPIEYALGFPQRLIAYVRSVGHGHKVGRAVVAAGGLRSYIRYLQFRGDVDPQLLCAIPLPPRPSLKDYPRTLSDTERQALIGSFDTDTAVGMRDHAMALCMLQMGLRASEVAGMVLQDIDWRVSILHVRRDKSRSVHDLPLMHSCGSAIARYLTKGRPSTETRRVFVRHVVPVGTPYCTEDVRGAMRRAYARAGFPTSLTGTHILRHTAATEMLNNGATLKSIADVLGHGSIDTTMICTKVDTQALQWVAQPWPEDRV